MQQEAPAWKPTEGAKKPGLWPVLCGENQSPWQCLWTSKALFTAQENICNPAVPFLCHLQSIESCGWRKQHVVPVLQFEAKSTTAQNSKVIQGNAAHEAKTSRQQMHLPPSSVAPKMIGFVQQVESPALWFMPLEKETQLRILF